MSGTHADRYHRLLVVGLAWLLILFVVGVLAANRPVPDEVPLQVQARSGADVGGGGRILLLPGDPALEAVATLRFSLPPPDPTSSRWVVWLARDPVDALWLDSPGWHSRSRHFFEPTSDEGVLPGGFLLPLPGDWHGDVSLVLHARAGTRVALRPRVLHEAAAMQFGRRGTV